MTVTRDNLWFALPSEPPFVLDIDRYAIERFIAGEACQPDQSRRIHAELMPEPYLGDPFIAPVILLNLNPGYSAEDCRFYADASRRRACRDNLEHKRAAYPFFLLNPDYALFSGPRWWRAKLKQLIVETSLEQVARKVCCIEYFPYHSPKFGFGKLILESQRYSFDLVRRAIADRKIIVAMRARRLWENAVPELKSHHCLELNSPQSVWITRNNISEGGFDHIKKAIAK
ncbi:MAG: hypothetical protein KJ065_19300 [Anaerolineae bacterium]|nr:hypothetical protein [Anaerolineae bacterium]